MKKKNSLLILIGLFLLSCSKDTDYKFADLSESISLSNPTKLFQFDYKYPIDIAAKDSLAVVLFDRADACLGLYNINTRQSISQFGLRGNGPGEVISLNFITNKQYALQRDSIYFTDINKGRLLAVSLKMYNDSIVLNDLIKYPREIYPSSNMNIAGDFIIGRNIKMTEKKMFYIYNRRTKNLKTVDFFPKINILENSKNYYYAPHLALNEQKGKIIAGMYFMDMVHVYDINGRREKSICFSKRFIPSIKRKVFDLEKGVIGIKGIYPTENYCYINRSKISHSNSDENSQETLKTFILKVDWNGNLIASYVLSGKFSGGFSIDEDLNRLYIIKNSIEANNTDYWDVVYYDLK